MCPSPDNEVPPEGGKLRVLVVDDEPTLRLGFAYALSNKTTVVETANNGRQALEKLGPGHFDVMVLDIRMPDLDGIGVIQALRARGDKIPVILCSAALSPDAALRAIRKGVVDFLPKPVRPVDLRDAVAFVTTPDGQPFSKAMRAMRGGLQDEAIAILEDIPGADMRTMCWLALLRAIRDGEEAHILEDKIRATLSHLAFKTDPI